ncbi:MAG: sigma-70 family RNA polymerase sigma factor [Patescibacteria group bacterium]|nr:sigma-70 family RNA polymerase sigma factor [Patescibacteria group bacterium]
MSLLDGNKNLSDEQLAVLSLDDHLSFSILINRYKDKLLNYIKRISNFSQEDASDILQDVFLKVYLNLNDFNSDLKFSSWIYSITRNQVISNYRKFKIRPEGNSTPIDELAVRKIIHDFDIKKEIDIKIDNKIIFSVLNAIKPKWKEILILRFFEEKDYSEISDIIKKPSGTVASMLNKAKKEFRKKYQEKYN